MITDQSVLIKPQVALEHAPQITNPPGGTEPNTPTPSGETPGEGGIAPEKPGHRHFHGVYTVNSELYSKDFTKLSQEILQHLAAAEDAKIEITVELKATSESGYSDQAARTILENAKALKFNQSTFE